MLSEFENNLIQQTAMTNPVRKGRKTSILRKLGQTVSIGQGATAHNGELMLNPRKNAAGVMTMSSHHLDSCKLQNHRPHDDGQAEGRL